jgi:DNA invertase Pin-like site-specific DNA recombinase
MYVIADFADNAVSGTVLDRPGLSAAIDGMTPGMVLVVDTCDRLARDMLVSLTIRHQVDKAGCTIEFADGSPSATTPEGELFQNILSAFASYERARIARRTSEGLKRKQASGEHIGRPPVGYRVDPETKRLVEDKREQRAMRHIQRLAARGHTTSVRIAHFITGTHGHFRGKPWSARTIRRIISGN